MDSARASFLDKNIAAIRARYPQFGKEILEQYAPTHEAEIEPTDAGAPTVRYRGMYLHSRRDPIREAERVVSSSVPGRTGTCIALGFGLGYFVEAFRRLFPLLPVVVVEPDVPLFLRALETRDLCRLLSDEAVSLFLDIDPDSLQRAFSQLPDGNLHLLCPRSLYRLDPAYYDAARDTLGAILDRREINRNTLKRFGTLWIRNLVRNLPLLNEGRGIAGLESLYTGIPALIVAAGPSLDEVTPHLHRIAERAVIIAVDTSLRACLNAGVRPDFLVVVDPQYWNSRHLDGCDTSDITLLSETSTHPAVFRHPYAQLLFCSSLFPLGRFIEAHLEMFGKLGAGGSVSTTAWDFARFLGCSPIYCAGLDLGFPDAKTHFHGSLFEELSHSLSHRLLPAQHASFLALHDASPFPVRSNDGGEVHTDRRLILYRNWFESRLRDDASIVSCNLSSGGVRIDGMELRPVSSIEERPGVRERIDRLFKRHVLDTHKAPGATSAGVDGEEGIRHVVKRLIGELESLARIAERGIDEIRALEESLGDRSDISRHLKELDSIDRMLVGSSTKDIAGFLMQDLIDEITGAGDGGGDEEIVDRSRRIYEEIATSARYHTSLLRKYA